MSRLSEEAHSTLFTEARSLKAFTDKPVENEILESIYNTVKFGPTAFNCTPMRILYVTSEEGKSRLIPLMSEGNRSKSSTAPVLAVLAYDVGFPEHLPKLAPFIIDYIAANPSKVEPIATNNSWLQGGYFITAARAHGLDVGPMGGFDSAKVNEEFFFDCQWKAFLVVALGYGDSSKLHPRGQRLSYEEAVKMI